MLASKCEAVVSCCRKMSVAAPCRNLEARTFIAGSGRNSKSLLCSLRHIRYVGCRDLVHVCQYVVSGKAKNCGADQKDFRFNVSHAVSGDISVSPA